MRLVPTSPTNWRLTKYTGSHFVTDIKDFKATRTCFDVGSRGFVNRDNRERLRRLHKFTDKSVKLKKFIENISCISILSSYYIFIARNEPSWTDPPYISPPKPNQ